LLFKFNTVIAATPDEDAKVPVHVLKYLENLSIIVFELNNNVIDVSKIISSFVTNDMINIFH
jgi:hypothetical protein